MEDVVLMPSALTLWAASTARVNQDTPEMDASAQVNELGTIVISKSVNHRVVVSVSRRSRDVLVSVSSREKLSTSRSRLGLGRQTSRFRIGLGQLRLVLKTNFRPNCAGHINKTYDVNGL